MKNKKEQRFHRRLRIRAKVNGTADRPRVSVFRSNKYLSAQLINDEKGETLGSARVAGVSVVKAKELGLKIVEVAGKKHLKTLVFDRGGYRYHGVVKALADTLREGGLTV